MRAFNWSKQLGRALGLVFLWALVALGVNAVSPAGIAWVGTWPATYGSDTAAMPPSYEDGDAPILRLDEAIARYQLRDVIFVDAREPEDYAMGHIPGAISFPFDYYDEHSEAVLPRLREAAEIVTYCGGADCELSLYMARQLALEGFENLSIFFGGAESWEEAGLPMTEGETP